MTIETESFRMIVIGDFDNESMKILIESCSNFSKGKIEVSFSKDFPKEQHLSSIRNPFHVMIIGSDFFKKHMREIQSFSKFNPVGVLHMTPDFFDIKDKNIDQALIDKKRKTLVDMKHC